MNWKTKAEATVKSWTPSQKVAAEQLIDLLFSEADKSRVVKSEYVCVDAARLKHIQDTINLIDEEE